MSVMAVTTLHLECNQCGRVGEVAGDNKKLADKAARHAGWAFDMGLNTALCLRCRPRTYVQPPSWKQKRVERAYGRPFWDVVGEFGAQGLSLTAVAEKLGYRRRSLASLMIRHGKRGLIPSRRLDRCSP